MTPSVFRVPVTSESAGWQLWDIKWCFTVHLFDMQMMGVTQLWNFLRPPSQSALPMGSGRDCWLLLSLLQVSCLWLSACFILPKAVALPICYFFSSILQLFFHELLPVFKEPVSIGFVYVYVFFCIYLQDHFFLKSKRLGISHAEVEFSASLLAIWAATTFRLWICRVNLQCGKPFARRFLSLRVIAK